MAPHPRFEIPFIAGSTAHLKKVKHNKCPHSLSTSDLTVQTNRSNTPLSTTDQNNINSFDPVGDGPPFPRRTRALNNQVQKPGSTEKHPSQKTKPANSSSISDSQSWENVLDSFSLTRNLSQRSNRSSMLSRERSERDSLQKFGKAIFGRRGKFRKESVDYKSAPGSIYSDNTSITPNDSFESLSREPSIMNSLLTRRKPSKPDEALCELAQRKIYISEPYNFQHVSHTPKHSVGDISVSGELHQEGYFPDASSSTQRQEATRPDPVGQADQSWFNRARLASRPPPVRTSMRRVQSQEQLCAPPPRPPRSPTEYDFSQAFPRPPRTSNRSLSHTPVYHDHTDPANAPCTIERPATSTGIHATRPSLSIATQFSNPWLGQLDSPGPRVQEIAPDSRPPHAVNAPEDITRLVSSAVSNSLPDVPEEEEGQGLTRMNITDKRASLKPSASVPLLRQFMHHDGTFHHDTFDHFDLFAAQDALRTASALSCDTYDQLSRESWEDDIDYCYEHAAEADDNFAWERSSCDGNHDQVELPLPRTHHIREKSSPTLSPFVLLPRPATKPAPKALSHSASSSDIGIPLVGPTVTSNFSRPRTDSSMPLQRGHNPQLSQTSIFEESQGFDLSPSLLIPNDYHQQMLLHERREYDDDTLPSLSPYQEISPCSTTSRTFYQTRSSASTTYSSLSEQSTFSSRYRSGMSSLTAHTSWTAESPCASTCEWREVSGDEGDNGASEFENNSVASPSVDGEMANPIYGAKPDGHIRAQSHADLFGRLAGVMPPGPRPRARTISKGNNMFPPRPTAANKSDVDMSR